MEVLMKCPFCGHENTRVIDSRPAEDNNSIRRRRVCDECDKRFTTYEKIETIPLIIIKKDNNRETYDRAKIEAGVPAIKDRSALHRLPSLWMKWKPKSSIWKKKKFPVRLSANW